MSDVNGRGMQIRSSASSALNLRHTKVQEKVSSVARTRAQITSRTPVHRHCSSTAVNFLRSAFVRPRHFNCDLGYETLGSRAR